MMSQTAEDIVQKVRLAGVVGSGGAGFPAYVKLQAKVQTIIANGSECEPLLATDKTLLKKNPDLVIEGMLLAMKATSAKEGIIGIKGHYKEVVASLTKALENYKNSGIRLHLLENYYPAGDEFLLVHDITGKVIPEGAIPLQVGVVVTNVVTLSQMAEAVSGKNVTERLVTLAGAFHKPQVLSVPIGTTYAELIKIAGGTNCDDPVFLDGGPMMGAIVSDINLGIGKTTSGLIALPREHFIIRMKEKTLPQMVKQSKSACCQCSRCTDLCPRHLLGHELYPHMTMRTIDYNLPNAAHVTSAFLCCQCGVCEMIACDFMFLSPKKIYAEYKKQLIMKGIKNPHTRKTEKAREALEDRKISTQMLMKKLNLSPYYSALDYSGLLEVERVRIPIKKHIGAPAKILVSLQHKIKMGDVIAASPDNALGSIYHASLSGTITDISEDWVEITK